jgi:hypothetical protein
MFMLCKGVTNARSLHRGTPNCSSCFVAALLVLAVYTMCESNRFDSLCTDLRKFCACRFCLSEFHHVGV